MSGMVGNNACKPIAQKDLSVAEQRELLGEYYSLGAKIKA
jgi:hypothetical protein